MVRRFRRNPLAMIGACLFAVVLGVAALGPAVVRSSPFDVNSTRLLPPGGAHRLGTDNLGHDVLSEAVHGAGTSLLVGLGATALSACIGLATGVVAGFSGGWVDDAMMRVTEIFLVVPRFFAALIVVAILGAHLSLIITVLGLLAWPEVARVLRAEFLSLKSRPFVIAAVSCGATNTRLIFKQMLPNALPPVVIVAALQVANAILLEAGLSFLGLGDPTVVSWGSMLSAAQPYFGSAWWMAVFPGAAILVTTLSVYLMADGLNEALNPRIGSTRA